MRCPACAKTFSQGGYRFCPYDATPLTADAPEASATSKPAASTREIGTLLGGRYLIRQFLAKGGMARVFTADDQHTGALVAVKILDKRKAKNNAARKRFIREATAVSMIDHENVITIHEVGACEDGTPFLVMDLLRGESLGDRLRAKHTIDKDVALPLLREACAGLWAAHSKGIVHRDIKPDNLYLLGEPSQPGGMRVLDFGLSRVFGSTLTNANTVIGTPGYMAPEQVIAEPVDQRTDVFGLGMVMYRMFAGRLPFQGPDHMTILAKQLFAKTPSPKRHVPELADPIERVIMRAIRKQPENRYPSMQLFGDDLKKLAMGMKIHTPEIKHDKYDLSSNRAQQVATGYRKWWDSHAKPDAIT